MKISEIKDSDPAMGLRSAKPARGSQEEVTRVPAEGRVETGEPDGTSNNAAEPAATPPLLDFQPSGVRNDFSSKYRRAALALEGAIYRVEQSQVVLLSSGEASDGVIALPENSNLQQTADGLAMLAHIESVKFRNSG